MPRCARGGGESARASAWHGRFAAAGLATVALFGGCVAPPPPPPSPLSLYLQARVAKYSAQSGRAALLLMVAAALAPEQAPIQAALGEARLALGDDAGARIALERATLLDPDAVAPAVLLARLDVRDRRPQDALERLLAIDERRPGRKEVLELAHPLLLWSGATERGLAVFDRALEIAPDLALAHEARGDFLACLGRPDDALASYRRALALDPARRGAELKAAHLLEKQGESILRKLPPLSAPAAPGVGLSATEDAAPGTR
jgi:tetratricopeptide (TPR) repeat protein